MESHAPRKWPVGKALLKGCAKRGRRRSPPEAGGLVASAPTRTIKNDTVKFLGKCAALVPFRRGSAGVPHSLCSNPPPASPLPPRPHPHPESARRRRRRSPGMQPRVPHASIHRSSAAARLTEETADELREWPPYLVKRGRGVRTVIEVCAAAGRLRDARSCRRPPHLVQLGELGAYPLDDGVRVRVLLAQGDRRSGDVGIHLGPDQRRKSG